MKGTLRRRSSIAVLASATSMPVAHVCSLFMLSFALTLVVDPHVQHMVASSLFGATLTMTVTRHIGQFESEWRTGLANSHARYGAGSLHAAFPAGADATPLARFLATSKFRMELMHRFLRAPHSSDLKRDHPELNSTVVHVVMGNGAGDLDSIASSIAYAYHLDALYRSSGGDGRVVYVPVINFAASDLSLRREAVHVLERLGIDEGNLVFVADAGLGALMRNARLRLSLVDHNSLSHEQAHLAPAIVEIIDHHEDARAHLGAVREIAPVGSCCTLIAERMMRRSASCAMCGLDATVAELLLSAVLVDTMALDESRGRTTARDAAAALYLEAVSGADREALFAAVLAAKFNSTALAARDHLRRDYKEDVFAGLRIGVSSVSVSLATLLADSGLARDIGALADSRSLDALVLMAAHFAEGRLVREVVLVPRAADAHGILARFVSSAQAESLGLAARDVPDALQAVPGAIVAHQGNVRASRKVLMPLLRQHVVAERLH